MGHLLQIPKKFWFQDARFKRLGCYSRPMLSKYTGISQLIDSWPQIMFSFNCLLVLDTSACASEVLSALGFPNRSHKMFKGVVQNVLRVYYTNLPPQNKDHTSKIVFNGNANCMITRREFCSRLVAVQEFADHLIEKTIINLDARCSIYSNKQVQAFDSVRKTTNSNVRCNYTLQYISLHI